MKRVQNLSGFPTNAVARDANYYLNMHDLPIVATVGKNGMIYLTAYGKKKMYDPEILIRRLSQLKAKDFEQIDFTEFLEAIAPARRSPGLRKGLAVEGEVNRALCNLGLNCIQGWDVDGRIHLTTNHGETYIGSYDPDALLDIISDKNRKWNTIRSPYRIWKLLIIAEEVEV